MFTAARRIGIPGSQAPFINYVACLAAVRGAADACRAWLQVQCGGNSVFGAVGLGEGGAPVG